MDVGGSPDSTQTDPTPSPGGTSSVSAVVAVLGATLLVLVLATWAASIGPDSALSGEGFEPRRVTPSETPTDDPTDPVTSDGERMGEDPPDRAPGWLRAAAVAVELAALGLLLYLVARVFRRAWLAWRSRRRRQRRPPDVDFEVLSPPQALAEEMVRDADDQRALLVGGDPRNGIVACWHRFEVQAEAAEIGRKPWETASEFTLRILDLVSADERAVGRLAAAYREARFSDHELSEDLRAEAALALDAIHRSLGVRPWRAS